ncbi:uncharacterized protein MONOS_9791 [Monocercomonoides exilis]|uniref:uncharacterized protein n=1 Tax=Monocercomonoides exilis TaxID=2049356 RepID=UPI0035598343|nr:hypothetical protein MONOS_9791 [Monocercomonoides exilis]|eukprot:MONOS_9791.1-p1 / transcript=MONOS_9791.1 / gene=MONOS_9791 / organism=Monocercomonoides_exilis_PA203 / gene_product=unspecified product / transcript_product=unspecified product / location=Mono_scaffold00417:48254-48562(+) / protein_length=103 / sequence_SO=supercontig / SO=protein_coding / is_pseudo=false
MSKEVPVNLRKLVDSTGFFRAEGDATVCCASHDSSAGFGLATARSETTEKIQFGKEHPGIRIQTTSEKGIRKELHRLQGKEENAPVPSAVCPNHRWEASPYH